MKTYMVTFRRRRKDGDYSVRQEAMNEHQARQLAKAQAAVEFPGGYYISIKEVTP